jgi:hypothetical protein
MEYISQHQMPQKRIQKMISPNIPKSQQPFHSRMHYERPIPMYHDGRLSPRSSLQVINSFPSFSEYSRRPHEGHPHLTGSAAFAHPRKEVVVNDGGADEVGRFNRGGRLFRMMRNNNRRRRRRRGRRRVWGHHNRARNRCAWWLCCLAFCG